MNIYYKISDKLLEQEFVKGKEISRDQVLSFEASDLSKKARKYWIDLFDVSSNSGYLCDLDISDGKSIEEAPQIKLSNYIIFDKLLTIDDLEAVLHRLVIKKQKLLPILKRRIEEWKIARAWIKKYKL